MEAVPGILFNVAYVCLAVVAGNVIFVVSRKAWKSARRTHFPMRAEWTHHEAGRPGDHMKTPSRVA
jgi:hypothetical protein